LFRQVIDQQNVGGWWPSAGPLLALVNGHLPEFPEPEVGAGGKRDEVIATIVGLAILREKCGEQGAIWRLIEQKAVRWLRGQGIDYEPLIARVIAALGD
jgi:hypothetical protein